MTVLFLVALTLWVNAWGEAEELPLDGEES